MTNEEIWVAQRAARQFQDSPAGAAFSKFESRIGRAWVTDSTSNSSARMTRDWDAANAARRDCIDAIKALHMLVADLSANLTDGANYSVDGLHEMRRRVANTLPPNVCPEWLARYRDTAKTKEASS